MHDKKSGVRFQFGVRIRARTGRGDKKHHERALLHRMTVSVLSSSHGEHPALVILHVSHTANRLNLRLEGTKLIIMSVVSTLKQILVASVAGVLVSDPTRIKERNEKGQGSSHNHN